MPSSRRRNRRKNDAGQREKGKRWCFTINFKGRERLSEEDCLPRKRSCVRYRIYQGETGETGTPHLQGYFECTRDVSLRSIKRWEGFERAHLELARGTAEDNRRYCSKEEGRQIGPFEEGDPDPEPGKRNDLLRLKDAIDKGEPDSALFDVSFGSAVRYFRGLNHYRLSRVPARTEAPKVLVYWGDAGAGKSRRAWDICRGRGWTVYPKNNTKWWDGYHGQKAVIFTEFDPRATSFRYLLELLDRYPVKVEVKGNVVEFNSSVIFLCANYHPKDWYIHEDYSPLERRIEKIIHFKYEGSEGYEKPHECENEEDSLDEGEATVPGSDCDWDEEEELEELKKQGVVIVSPVRRRHVESIDLTKDVEETCPVLYSEIPEEIRQEIREGKKEIFTEGSGSAKDPIDLTKD